MIFLIFFDVFFRDKNINGKKTKFFISNKIAEKKGIFVIYKNFYFWEFYLNEEIQLSKVELESNLNHEDVYFRKIMELSIILIGLKIDLNLLTKIIIEYLAKKYIKNVIIFFIIINYYMIYILFH